MGSERELELKRSPFVRQVLLQCAESCESALYEYTASTRVAFPHDVFRELLRAIATMRTAADLIDEENSRRELALRLCDDACARAAAVCRRSGLDEPLLRCAVACERAADEAQLVLTALGHDLTAQL
jgi:hypothetical protein